MANITTDYFEDLETGIIKLNQDATADGEDGRVWRDLTGNSFYITDDYKIAKKTLAGAVTKSSAISSITNTNQITMALNKVQDIVYILADRGNVYLYEVTVSTMTLNGGVDLGTTPRPLSMVISKSPDPKIWWNADNEKVYKMDLDGGNISNVSLTEAGAGDSPTNFSLSLDNIGYVQTVRNTLAITIEKITIIGGNLSIEHYYSSKTDGENGIGSFIIDDHFYVLSKYFLNWTKIKLYKIPLATWDNDATWTIKDIKTDYSLTEITQFFTDGTYGYFYENDDGANQKMWRADLSDLSCISLKQHSLIDLEFKFEASGTEQTIICLIGSDNCDPAGFLVSGKGATGGV